MGFNCMLAVVRDATVADLAAVGMTPVGEPVDGDEGLAAGTYVLQQHGTDVVVLDGTSMFIDAAPIIASLTGREVVGVILSSVADTYGLDAITPGGRRQVVSQEGEIVLDRGEALPGEPAAWDEDTTLELFERLSGRSTGDVLDAQGVPVRGPSAERAVGPAPTPDPDPGPAGTTPRRRGFFRRR
jgi:hypothetical protein